MMTIMTIMAIMMVVIVVVVMMVAVGGDGDGDACCGCDDDGADDGACDGHSGVFRVTLWSFRGHDRFDPVPRGPHNFRWRADQVPASGLSPCFTPDVASKFALRWPDLSPMCVCVCR